MYMSKSGFVPNHGAPRPLARHNLVIYLKKITAIAPTERLPNASLLLRFSGSRKSAALKPITTAMMKIQHDLITINQDKSLEMFEEYGDFFLPNTSFTTARLHQMMEVILCSRHTASVYTGCVCVGSIQFKMCQIV